MAKSNMSASRRMSSYNIYNFPHLANGPWKKSLNFIFPTKYGIPKVQKVSHWLSKFLILQMKFLYLENLYHTSPWNSTKNRS